MLSGHTAYGVSQEAVDDYMEFHDELGDFEEAYCGEWDSEEDFVRHIVSE